MGICVIFEKSSLTHVVVLEVAGADRLWLRIIAAPSSVVLLVLVLVQVVPVAAHRGVVLPHVVVQVSRHARDGRRAAAVA